MYQHDTTLHAFLFVFLQVPPIVPPAQPPSLERAVLCDLRARSAMALSALLEHREMVAKLAPLMPAFAEGVLRAASEVRLHAGELYPVPPPPHPDSPLLRREGGDM